MTPEEKLAHIEGIITNWTLAERESHYTMLRDIHVVLFEPDAWEDSLQVEKRRKKQ